MLYMLLQNTYALGHRLGSYLQLRLLYPCTPHEFIHPSLCKLFPSPPLSPPPAPSPPNELQHIYALSRVRTCVEVVGGVDGFVAFAD